MVLEALKTLGLLKIEVSWNSVPFDKTVKKAPLHLIVFQIKFRIKMEEYRMAGNKNSGGGRVGAGRKPKSLEEKLLSGNPGKRKLQVLKFPDVANLKGQDMPPPRKFLSSSQKNGKEMIAVEIYGKTWAWLKDRKCDQLVTAELLEQYAMSVSRWIQCEECISEFGFLAKHPTTGNAIPSPYIAMAQSFMKQTNNIWYQVFQIVKENCTEDFSGSTPQDDIMAYLLTTRKDN